METAIQAIDPIQNKWIRYFSIIGVIVVDLGFLALIYLFYWGIMYGDSIYAVFGFFFLTPTILLVIRGNISSVTYKIIIDSHKKIIFKDIFSSKTVLISDIVSWKIAYLSRNLLVRSLPVPHKYFVYTMQNGEAHVIKLPPESDKKHLLPLFESAIGIKGHEYKELTEHVSFTQRLIWMEV